MLGALVALLPKSLAALLMTEFRPVGKPCAKFVIFSKVVDSNFRRSIEEYKTVAEVQEGFRANRSTKRQITKLQCLVERSRRRRTISVMLYLDIKNAFIWRDDCIPLKLNKTWSFSVVCMQERF